MAYNLPTEGTRRLKTMLGLMSAVAILVAIAVTVVLHGAPYWPIWWAVMALAVVASFVVGRALTPILEWVIAGYRSGP